MRITDTDVIVTNPGRNYVLVKLETDEHVGWGDATLNGREKAVEAALEHHVLPEMEGRDGSRIEDAWQSLFRHTYWRGGPVLNSALSGVDMALWDLKGKQAGMPVYDLLGGRTRDHAAVYKRCDDSGVDAIIENCHDAMDRGVGHFRVNIKFEREEYLDLNTVVETVRSVRGELGPEPELLIDIHGRANVMEAARVGKRLEETDPFFLEDPVRPENPDVFERLRAQTATPLAMGELFDDPWQMVTLIERDLIDYIRVDLAHVGGITPARKLAAIGEHHYVHTAFHGPPDLSPVGYAATVHMDVSIPNFGIQELTEHEKKYGAPLADVFAGGVEFVEGKGAIDVPDEPGLGIEVDEVAAREYVYEREHLPQPRNPDGSVQDW